MSYNWKPFRIKRFNGLDLKTNIVDVEDGRSLDVLNAYQAQSGKSSKRPGSEVMFAADEAAGLSIAEVGSATLAGTKYWFKFVNGKFKYATSRTGATTEIAPAPAIETLNQIWTVAMDNKLFFVDGSNVLRYFDGTVIKSSAIYARPTVPLTSASGVGTFTYIYTVDNGLGESPAVAGLLPSIISAAIVRVTGNTGPQTLIAGDVVRIYSRADTIAAASKLVASFTWDAAAVTAGLKDIATVAITDSQPQLYSELGLALNLTAPTALAGIISHYGRIVGWKSGRVYNSKVSNVHSWPSDSAQKEAFVYGFGVGDGEDISCCTSFREALIVMKPSNIAIFGGTGPDDTGGNAYSFRRLEVNGKGCVAPKSVQIIGEKNKSYLTYLSRSGFMATDGSTPLEIGEDVAPAIQSIGAVTQSASVSVYDKRLGLYLCFIGSASIKDCWVFDVRPDEGVFVGWWKWQSIPATCVSWDGDRFMFGTSAGVCASQRVALIAQDFSDVQQEYFATGAVDTSTEQITVGISYATGDPVIPRTNGTIPAGLVANTTYFAIRVSPTVIKLATSAANALAGTAVNITSVGAGTHSLISAKAIDGYYTTNWIHFGKPTVVKKLAKPGFIFNALANSINLTVSVAYDWVPQFSGPKTISIGSTDAWGTEAWAGFTWGAGATASPKNFPLSRRKCRSIRYKFQNSTINQDFDIQGLEQPFDFIRNRGNYPA